MKIVLFGATGMVGQGVLRECLAAADVDEVLAVVRSPLPQKDPRLTEIVHRDFTDFTGLADTFAGSDACLFCLGVSSTGLSESDYRAVTYGFTLAAAEAVGAVNPALTFVYISGAGADSSERGRLMWARVRGETENALLRLPFRVRVLRPGFIQPLHGITSKTTLYRVLYRVIGPTVPLLRRVFPRSVTTTESVGRAMLALARRKDGPGGPVYDSRGINQLAGVAD